MKTNSSVPHPTFFFIWGTKKQIHAKSVENVPAETILASLQTNRLTILLPPTSNNLRRRAILFTAPELNRPEWRWSVAIQTEPYAVKHDCLKTFKKPARVQIRWRRRHWLCKEKLAVLLISISFPLRRWNHLQGDVLHPKCCDNINANITGGPLLSTFPYIKQHFSHLIASRLSFWPLLQKLNTRNCKKKWQEKVS